ncbi:hypothetical protein [Cohnella yongneupensis]|uniref:Uncharacterized protein n=1 Tax=Cohnella yongneupensis TaxID=425006 RepID=A0ABW0QTY8_9BACL
MKNIHDISHGQRGFHNELGVPVIWASYADYVRFCLTRRSYKSKQGKGLWRSETSVAKQRSKAAAYKHKLRKRGRKVQHA